MVVRSNNAPRDRLEIANENAAKTGAYYSAVVVVKAALRLVVAGIGHVKLWLFREGGLRAQLEPSILTVTDQPVAPALLTGTLGLGFSPDRIQGCEIIFDTNEFALITMECDLVRCTEFRNLD